jgi:hypothetical protein
MPYNIYCDESCHLEHDKQTAMVLGAVWCSKDNSDKINNEIKEIKVKHNLSKYFEIKWTKVSAGKLNFYHELVEYFFENPDLHFRALVIPDKSILNHEAFNQTHDDWYYKMYFNLLNKIIEPRDENYIYLDIKDTRSAGKVRYLENVLRSSEYDFESKVIKKVQNIHSHESQQMQLADLLIGAVSYENRGIETSDSKISITDLIKKTTGYSLKKSTLLSENKFNIFIWKP